VSFHVVFEAQARSNESNAVLLLDEPGVSLHALKQEAFRETITKLAARNQTLFTTHSPFMVGSDEMNRVRIVELPSRATGTVVHQDFAVGDARSLFLLQSHFGYVLGQALFEQQRNLVVEGITDYWYLLTLSDAAREAGEAALDDELSIVPAGDAGKIVYHASVLNSRGWRVAALFDSDAAGRAAAEDEAFVHLMKKERIYFVGDFYDGIVEQPELEDLLRGTLLRVARDELGIDAFERAVAQPRRSVCDLLGDGVGRSFSKYRLAKAFLRWMRYHSFADLSDQERYVLLELFAAVNQATV
jgi:predicted ATP-dependent endonuclease of OLD family